MEGQAIGRGEASPTWFFNHLPAILWQRRIFVITTFAVLFIASIVAAFALPTIYRSTATLLVQSQDLPSTIVESPTTGAIQQRIARIRERVLSRGDLIAIIEQNDLYVDERKSAPMSQIIEEMRESTMVGALASDIGTPAGGTNDPVALTVSFDYPDPEKAQVVLQSYVTKFLQMDTEDVEDQATLTVRFLQDQASKLQGQIAQIEGALTSLKARHGSSLAAAGVSPMLDTGSYSAQITSLENQNRQLMMMSRRPPERTSAVAAAEAALATARATYNDSHPDVQMARERLEELRRIAQENPNSSDAAGIQEQISANNAAIQSLIVARNAAMGRASSTMAGQARAPAIMERAMQLESRAATLRQQYQDVSTNLLKAQNSARMAVEQRAERLSLVEPPSLPDTPHSPNRPLLIAAGAIAGLLLGLVLALAVEFISRPLRSPVQLHALRLPVLGVVPLLTAEERKPWFSFLKRRERKVA